MSEGPPSLLDFGLDDSVLHINNRHIYVSRTLMDICGSGKSNERGDHVSVLHFMFPFFALTFGH